MPAMCSAEIGPSVHLDRGVPPVGDLILDLLQKMALEVGTGIRRRLEVEIVAIHA